MQDQLHLQVREHRRNYRLQLVSYFFTRTDWCSFYQCLFCLPRFFTSVPSYWTTGYKCDKALSPLRPWYLITDWGNLASIICIAILLRSRLADFISNCQPEARSISGCLRENYADCLLSYSGLIGKLFWGILKLASEFARLIMWQD